MAQIMLTSILCFLALAPAAWADSADTAVTADTADTADTGDADQPSAPSPTAGGTAPARAPGDARLPQIVVNGNRPADALQEKNQQLDESRDKDLLPKLGATSYDIDQQAVETLPQGKNTPIDKVLLQAPGVSYDSRSAIRISTSATNTQTFNTASTAFSFPTESPHWARYSRPVSSAT